MSRILGETVSEFEIVQESECEDGPRDFWRTGQK